MFKYFIISLKMLVFLSQCNAQFQPSATIEKVGRLNNVCFYNDKIFFLDCNGISNSVTLITKNGGKDFFKINLFGSINNAVALSDSMFLVAQNTRIAFTQDQGNTWIYKLLINDNGDTTKTQNLYDFYIYKNGNGFITNFREQKNPEVYKTKNFGRTWNKTESTKYNFTVRDNKNSIRQRKQYNFNSTSYAMKQSSDSILIKYMNQGDSAIEINLAYKGIPGKVLQIAFKDEKNGMIITDYSGNQLQKIYLTNDSCHSFTEINKPSVNFEFVEYAKMVSLNEGFYIASFGVSTLTNTTGTYYTKDYGKTWFKNIDSNYLWSMNFYDAETGIVTIGLDVDFNTNIFYFTGNSTNIIKTENIENKIKTYPNPVNKVLNYSGLIGSGSFKVFNIQGQLLLNVTSLNNQIDVSTLSTGLYILNLETEQGTLVTKFIKQE